MLSSNVGNVCDEFVLALSAEQFFVAVKYSFLGAFFFNHWLGPDSGLGFVINFEALCTMFLALDRVFEVEGNKESSERKQTH